MSKPTLEEQIATFTDFTELATNLLVDDRRAILDSLCELQEWRRRAAAVPKVGATFETDDPRKIVVIFDTDHGVDVSDVHALLEHKP